MGLQNATISVMSNGEIRTTNIFALLTAIGAEFSRHRFLAEHHSSRRREASPTADHLLTLKLLAACFFLGLALGWLGFEYFRFAVILPFAFPLAALSILPIADDLMAAMH